MHLNALTWGVDDRQLVDETVTCQEAIIIIGIVVAQSARMVMSLQHTPPYVSIGMVRVISKLF